MKDCAAEAQYFGQTDSAATNPFLVMEEEDIGRHDFEDMREIEAHNRRKSYLLGEPRSIKHNQDTLFHLDHFSSRKEPESIIDHFDDQLKGIYYLACEQDRLKEMFTHMQGSGTACIEGRFSILNDWANTLRSDPTLWTKHRAMEFFMNQLHLCETERSLSPNEVLDQLVQNYAGRQCSEGVFTNEVFKQYLIDVLGYSEQDFDQRSETTISANGSESPVVDGEESADSRFPLTSSMSGEVPRNLSVAIDLSDKPSTARDLSTKAPLDLNSPKNGLTNFFRHLLVAYKNEIQTLKDAAEEVLVKNPYQRRHY